MTLAAATARSWPGAVAAWTNGVSRAMMVAEEVTNDCGQQRVRAVPMARPAAIESKEQALRVVVAAVVTALALPLAAGLGGGGAPWRNGAIVAAFTAPATLAGILACRRLRRGGPLPWWKAGAVGALIGLACALPFGFRDPTLLAFTVPVFANIGAVHGLVYWWLAAWRPRGRAGA
jgi:hypothetical protein